MKPPQPQTTGDMSSAWLGLGGTAFVAWLAMTPWLRDLQGGHHGGLGYPDYVFMGHRLYWLCDGLLLGLGVVFALRRKPGVVWNFVAACIAVTVFAFFGIYVLHSMAGGE